MSETIPTRGGEFLAFTPASTAAERLAGGKSFLKDEMARLRARHDAGAPGLEIAREAGRDHGRPAPAAVRRRGRLLRRLASRGRPRSSAGRGGRPRRLRPGRAFALERPGHHVPLSRPDQAGGDQSLCRVPDPRDALSALGLRPEGGPFRPHRRPGLRRGPPGHPDQDLPARGPVDRRIAGRLRRLRPGLSQFLHRRGGQGLHHRAPGRPGAPAVQVLRHDLQPGTGRQKWRRRPARLSERPVDGAGQTRHHPHGGAGRPALPQARGGDRVQPGLRFPPARAQRPAFPQPAPDRHAEPRPPAPGGLEPRLPPARYPDSDRALHAGVLPRGPGGLPPVQAGGEPPRLGPAPRLRRPLLDPRNPPRLALPPQPAARRLHPAGPRARRGVPGGFPGGSRPPDPGVPALPAARLRAGVPPGGADPQIPGP